MEDSSLVDGGASDQFGGHPSTLVEGVLRVTTVRRGLPLWVLRFFRGSATTKPQYSRCARIGLPGGRDELHPSFGGGGGGVFDGGLGCKRATGACVGRLRERCQATPRPKLLCVS